MNHKDAAKWKHTTAPNIYAVRECEQKIEVFDDEEPGFVSLYITDGKGLRFPARTVSMNRPEHFISVLSAWAARGVLIDSRNDKSIPLSDSPCQ